jgi:hypothetical protein
MIEILIGLDKIIDIQALDQASFCTDQDLHTSAFNHYPSCLTIHLFKLTTPGSVPLVAQAPSQYPASLPAAGRKSACTSATRFLLVVFFPYCGPSV